MATMFADKSVFDEDHPTYIGMYDGQLMEEAVRGFVESCDVVVTVGTMRPTSIPGRSPPNSTRRAGSTSVCTALRSRGRLSERRNGRHPARTRRARLGPARPAGVVGATDAVVPGR